MSRQEKTYLERPPEGNRLFRFYETNVSGKKLTIRYGRVGGTTLKHARTYPTGEEARADAARRIRARQRCAPSPLVEGNSPTGLCRSSGRPR